MPSPFPGMDPFLERPLHFAGFHHDFITFLQMAIQPQLPEQYFCSTGERIWVEGEELHSAQPDVAVARGGGPSAWAAESRGGAATLVEVETEPTIVTVPMTEERETYLEIRTRGDDGETLVTALELLSPANKRPGPGRDLYRRKQRETLAGQTHLIEIDLLRGGRHTTAVAETRLRRKFPNFDFHVCLKRFDSLEDYTVWAFPLERRLPRIGIPLLPGDPGIEIDLQAAFVQTYDIGPYRKREKYELAELDPPLPERLKAWAEGLLAARSVPKPLSPSAAPGG